MTRPSTSLSAKPRLCQPKKSKTWITGTSPVMTPNVWRRPAYCSDVLAAPSMQAADILMRPSRQESLEPPAMLRKYPVDALKKREALMTDPVTYSRSGPVATIVMEDGKANVMSLAMLNALQAAFDQAESDKTVPILKARGRHFSGGFDLNVFAKGARRISI
jgi:hypothetical protein